jgi:hypothetical protein
MAGTLAGTTHASHAITAVVRNPAAIAAAARAFWPHFQ